MSADRIISTLTDASIGRYGNVGVEVVMVGRAVATFRAERLSVRDPQSGRSSDAPPTPEAIRAAETNARMFVAAPGMLEALKECLPILEGLDTLRHLEAHFTALDKVRAAIAKATGHA